MPADPRARRAARRRERIRLAIGRAEPLGEHLNLIIAVYVRVSSEDQAELQTIKAQIDRLQKQLDAQEAEGYIRFDLYVDDGVSGTLPLAERPEGARLLDDARARRFGAVWLYKLDRLGRSLKAIMNAFETLDAMGVVIRSITEPFDTGTPFGRFMFQFLGSLAELDRGMTLDRLNGGIERVVNEGKWPGGPIPYGYVSAPGPAPAPEGGATERKKKRNASRPLVLSSVPVPEAGEGNTEADVWLEVMTRLAAGHSAPAEATRLNGLGVPAVTRYPGDGPARVAPGWTPRRILSLAHNTIYTGLHVRYLPGGAVSCRFPRLVSDALWARVQAALGENRMPPTAEGARAYLLRGLIRCGHCGRRYTGEPGPRRNGYDHQHYYRCCGQHLPITPDHPTRCRARMVAALPLERAIWADVLDFADHPEEALAEAERRLASRRKRARDDGERARLVARLAEKQTERERVLRLARKGHVPEADAERELAVVAQEEAALRGQLAVLAAEEELARAQDRHVEDARALLARLRARVDDLRDLEDGVPEHDAERRAWVEELVVKVEVRGLAEGRGGRGRRKPPEVWAHYVFEPRVRTVTGKESGSKSGATNGTAYRDAAHPVLSPDAALLGVARLVDASVSGLTPSGLAPSILSTART